MVIPLSIKYSAYGYFHTQVKKGLESRFSIQDNPDSDIKNLVMFSSLKRKWHAHSVESWTAMQHGARSMLLSRPAAIELSSFCLVRTNGF